MTPRIVPRDARQLVEFLRAVFGATGVYRPEPFRDPYQLQSDGDAVRILLAIAASMTADAIRRVHLINLTLSVSCVRSKQQYRTGASFPGSTLRERSHRL